VSIKLGARSLLRLLIPFLGVLLLHAVVRQVIAPAATVLILIPPMMVVDDVLVADILYHNGRATEEHRMIATQTERLTDLLHLLLFDAEDYRLESILDVSHPLIIGINETLPLMPYLLALIGLLIDFLLLSLQPLLHLLYPLILIELIKLVLEDPAIRSLPLSPTQLLIVGKSLLDFRLHRMLEVPEMRGKHKVLLEETGRERFHLAQPFQGERGQALRVPLLF
jgi:hypothetical protein